MFTGSSVALITPMKADGQGASSIDLEAFDALLAWHQQAGTASVVIGGTTGESATLDHEEYIQLLTHAVERLKGRVAVIAGTGSPSTEHTIHRTRLAQALGADAALVVTPAYNRPSQRGLLAHYQAVADASDLPVILYNVPSRTACDLLPETALALAKHERIVAIKEAVPDTARIQTLLDGGLCVLSGDDPTFVRSMEMGASGVISVASNIVPNTMARLCALAKDQQFDEARRINRMLEPLYAFLGVETNPVPAKWLLAQMGRCQDAIRLPLVGLDSQYHAKGQALIESIKAIDENMGGE